jgi:hypothetical protein
MLWWRRAIPAKCTPHIFGGGAVILARLLLGRADAHESIGAQREAQGSRDLAGQLFGLVETAFGLAVAVQRHRQHGIDRRPVLCETRGHQHPQRLSQTARRSVLERMYDLAQWAAEEKYYPHIAKACGEVIRAVRVGLERRAAALAEQIAKARAAATAIGEEQRQERVEQRTYRHGWAIPAENYWR